MLPLLSLLLWPLILGVGCKQTCSDGTLNCYEVSGGRYLVIPPSEASRSDELPLLMFIHGYSSSAEACTKKKWLIEEAAQQGGLRIRLPHDTQTLCWTLD